MEPNKLRAGPAMHLSAAVSRIQNERADSGPVPSAEGLGMRGGRNASPTESADARDLPARGREQSALHATLDHALAGLWMALQPIINWKSRSVFAYEGLMRSTDTALPHPGAILDAAERLERLDDVGLAVRESMAALIPSIPTSEVFINLHSSDLLSDALYDTKSALSRHASRVVLELTERATLDDVPDCRDRVRALRQMGYRVAIDDLGAGYSGLSSFALLEPEFVKFDMSLVRNVDREPVKQKLLRALTDLCRDMGIRVVAEGVETAEERDTLVALGCDLLQGFLFARPGPGFPRATL